MTDDKIRKAEQSLLYDEIDENDIFGKISSNSCTLEGDQGKDGQYTFFSKYVSSVPSENTQDDTFILDTSDVSICIKIVDDTSINSVKQNDYIINLKDGTFSLYKVNEIRDASTIVAEKLDEWNQTVKETRKESSETINVLIRPEQKNFNYNEVNYLENENYVLTDQSAVTNMSTADKIKLGIFDCSLFLKDIGTGNSVKNPAQIKTVVKCPRCGHEEDRYDGLEVDINTGDTIENGGVFHYDSYSLFSGFKGAGYLKEPIHYLRCASCGLVARGIVIKNTISRLFRVDGDVSIYSNYQQPFMFYTDSSTFEYYSSTGGGNYIVGDDSDN